MIISDIKLTKQNTYHKLSASIQFIGEERQRLFIQVPKQYRHFLSQDASPFLAALLLPSMKKTEDIFVDGSVSKREFDSLTKIMDLVASWDVGFSKIHITVQKIVKDKKKPENTGSFFTAGVDSFYTYLKHKKEITHLLLIHGCDIPLKDKTFFKSVRQRITQIVNAESIELVEIQTNMRDLLEKHLEWEWELGSALSSIALALRNGFKKVFIPSGMHYDELCPYGTHPDFDPLWSTENLSIVHDGCEARRLDKIFSIVQSSLALQNLRVCCHIIKGKYNCNTCFKCIQTKIELTCAGALQKAETFDKNLDFEIVKKTYYNCDLNFNKFGENALTYLRKHNIQPELQKALQISLDRSKHPSLVRRSADYIAHLDKTYNKRRLYSFIFSINENEDRTFIFKWIAKMGLVK